MLYCISFYVGNKLLLLLLLKNACRKKTRIYKIFLKHRTIASEIRYKTYKNILTSILRRASKKAHYCKLLDEQRYNITETWTFLTNVMGNNLQKSSYPGHFLSDGNRVEDKKRNCQYFKYIFTNVGPDLANKITVGR